MSYIFYGWTNPWFVLLMMFTTTVNYVCGLMIAGRWNPIGKIDVPSGGSPASPTQRKMAVVISAVASLGLLGFFKYFGFMQRNVSMILGGLGGETFDIMEFVLASAERHLTSWSSCCRQEYRSTLSKL
jgi:alginate O-acetyltransferase complex protein AlgI